jgi:hypothetical protein
VQGGVSSFLYGSGIGYTAAGGASLLTLGNAVAEVSTWNDRLQQTSMAAGGLLTLQFYPCPSGATLCSTNNGNIWRENT